MLGNKRAVLLGSAFVVTLAVGCGQKFTQDDTSGGAGNSSVSGSSGSGNEGGSGKGGSAQGGNAAMMAGRGGAASGSGGTNSAQAGTEPVMNGDAGAAGAPIDLPPPIPTDGLELWFDASRGVAQAGGLVGSWADQSGHHRDALQTAGNLRPKLVDGALAGKPALVFDGADSEGDYLTLPTLDLDYTAGLSIFFVAQQDTPADVMQCQPFFEASNGKETDDINVGIWQNSLIFEIVEGTVHDTNFPLLFDQPEVIGAMIDPSKRAVMRRNSNGVGEATIALPENKPRTEVFIGHSLYADCVPFKGAMGELIVYSRAVTDPELIQIEGYLQKRWGCCTK